MERDVAVKGRTVVSDLEAGMRSRKNKADGTERENAGTGEVQMERGIGIEIEDGTVKNGRGALQETERGAHAGIEMIDSIDWVSPARNPTRDLQQIPTSPLQTLLNNFLKPRLMFQHLPPQLQQTLKPQNL